MQVVRRLAMHYKIIYYTYETDGIDSIGVLDF